MFTTSPGPYIANGDLQAIWYGGDFGAYANPLGTGTDKAGTEEWLHDPRTETSADPAYLGWP